MRLRRGSGSLRSRLTDESSPDPVDAVPVDVSFDEHSMYTGVDAVAEMPVDVMPDVTLDEPVIAAPPPSSRSRAKAPAAETNAGPLAVCLACGESPPTSGECPHEEVAHIPSASAAVLAAIKKLQAAVQERRNQERALRKVVGVEVAAGNGDIEAKVRPNVLATPITLSSAPVARASRKKANHDAQAFFAFAAPPPPPEPAPEPVIEAPAAEPEPEPVVAASAEGEVVEAAPKKRGRKPRKPAAESAANPESATV